MAGGGRSRRILKYFKTASLAAAFFVMGLCVALLGPTIPTLAENLGVKEESLSFVFTTRGCGYLFGSVLSAILFKKMNPYLLFGLCLTLTSFGNYTAPFAPTAVILAAVLMIAGTSMGVLDTGGNVLCLCLWDAESEPWMQTLHFFFALGASLAPLVAKPFINEARLFREESGPQNITATLYEQNATTMVPATEGGFPYVAWAFIIPASLSMAVAIIFCFLSFVSEKKSESNRKNTVKKEGKKFRLQIIVLLFIFYLLYVGTEVAFGLFIYPFAINGQRHYSKHTGTMLNSLFWGTFAAGRFFAIFLTNCVTPKTMLTLDMVGTAIATTVMSLFPLYAESAEWILWVAVGLYGWSMASLFPSGISWAEHYITVTGKAASVFVVGASLGEMALPFVMGHMMAHNPMNLMYFSAASTGLCILNFLILQRIASAHGTRRNLSSIEVSYKETDPQSKTVEEQYVLLPTVEARLKKNEPSSDDC